MNTTDVNAERVITDLKRMMRDSEALLVDSTEALGDKARETQARLAKTLQAAKATCQQWEAKAFDGVKATSQIVREHPYQSLAAAAVVGVVLGLIFSRRTKSGE